MYFAQLTYANFAVAKSLESIIGCKEILSTEHEVKISRLHLISALSWISIEVTMANSAYSNDTILMPPPSIEFNGIHYELIKSAMLKDLIANKNVTTNAEQMVSSYESNGDYTFLGARAPIYGRYITANNQICINYDAINIPSKCEAIYQSKNNKYASMHIIEEKWSKPYQIYINSK